MTFQRRRPAEFWRLWDLTFPNLSFMTFWPGLTSSPERELLCPVRLYSEYGFESNCRYTRGIELAHLQCIERRVRCSFVWGCQVGKCECNRANAYMLHAGSSPSRKVAGYSSPIVALRKELDLYANIRPVVAVSPSRSFVDEELRYCFTSGVTKSRGKTIGRFDRGPRKHGVSGMPSARTAMDDSRKTVQYVKQETMTQTDSGREARATRLITERASRRIGRTAFELALARPRKVLLYFDLFTHSNLRACFTESHHHTQIQRAVRHGWVVQGDCARGAHPP